MSSTGTLIEDCWTVRSTYLPKAHPVIRWTNSIARDRLCEADQEQGLLYELQTQVKNNRILGCLGGSVGYASAFGSGHDLTVREFEPRVGLWADGSEPGACF